MLVNSSCQRGCGTRKEGGLYACVATGGVGLPIESFIVDHPALWTQGPFRGCQFVTREDGVVDMVMWVGEQFYPYPSDFVEEGRVHGFSKRVPLNADADYGQLTPYSSRMVLIHPNAVINSDYELRGGNWEKLGGIDSVPSIDRPSATFPHTCHHDPIYNHENIESSPCTFATWDLSALDSKTGHEVVVSEDGTYADIETPSVGYRVNMPLYPRDRVAENGDDLWLNSHPGIFLALPWSHFEYVSETDTLPDIVAGKLGDNINVTAVTPE